MKVFVISLFLFMSSLAGRAIVDITLVEPPAMALEKEWTVGWRNLWFGYEQWFAYKPMSGMVDAPPSVPRYTTLLVGPITIFAPGSVRVVAPSALLVVVCALTLVVFGWRRFRRRHRQERQRTIEDYERWKKSQPVVEGSRDEPTTAA